MPTHAEVLVPQNGYLLEGPRAVVVNGRAALAWVNIQHDADAKTGSVHVRYWDQREAVEWRLTGRPGFFVPIGNENVVLVGAEKEIGTLDLATGVWRTLAAIPDSNPQTIINDGEIEPDGMVIVFGTKYIPFDRPLAHLYRYSIADNRITVLADGQTCSNGKVFERRPDGLRLYDIDTPKKRVDRYRVDGETLTYEGVAIDLTNVDAFPDGMVDAGDGTVVIAFYNPHRGGDGLARCYSLATGEQGAEWITPGSPRVTCPLLLTRDGRRKIILTTATEGMPEAMRAESPNAGHVFIADA